MVTLLSGCFRGLVAPASLKADATTTTKGVVERVSGALLPRPH